ncbi:helix-turn-helix transcriptional regulator [Vibrio parahaemolyticus]|uniref:Helix-turn-helix transcriptional regulator n=1 Tax=Vibrio nitrifigilis TaxID=2789781 RepID=A0ABS0GBW4_9VIBR|nr:helix-turn-helix transcriptional regulator [Vibrio nitrifigilis]MBF8999889.1 helix-turn-helix transcriptional regulator [Vibrio nitrifigilis]
MEDNPIPTRLKQARKHAKITQKNLGIMIGMDESSASGRMNHYEKGRHTPDISTLKKMADALGVPLNYFFCEDNESAELATAISKLTIEQKNQVIEFIHNLQKEDI